MSIICTPASTACGQKVAVFGRVREAVGAEPDPPELAPAEGDCLRCHADSVTRGGEDALSRMQSSVSVLIQRLLGAGGVADVALVTSELQRRFARCRSELGSGTGSAWSPLNWSGTCDAAGPTAGLGRRTEATVTASPLGAEPVALQSGSNACRSPPSRTDPARLAARETVMCRSLLRTRGGIAGNPDSGAMIRRYP